MALVVDDDYEGAIFRTTFDDERIRLPKLLTKEQIDESSTEAQAQGSTNPAGTTEDEDEDEDEDSGSTTGSGGSSGSTGSGSSTSVEYELEVEEELALAVVYFVCSFISNEADRYKARAEEIIATYNTNK